MIFCLLVFSRADLHSAYDQPGLDLPARAGYPQFGYDFLRPSRNW